ncbi:hypothetical protein CVT24_002445 [Panaeolus cyanescens]|uniref:non-specific serine/threonine protein kinase n=1 Tax=Panaeolus cyanescens TaxID=181874 RepID=A0A409X616_9AGAR|nr:hypothetical protein CVT24_002445 [Panaeolus cyanescens]
MLKLFSSLRAATTRKSALPQLSSPASTLVLTARLKDQAEPQQRYQKGGYHPVHPGEIYNDRYRVIHKLGWGISSTIWLVQDTRSQSMAAMKVLIGDLTAQRANGGWDELGALQNLKTKNTNSIGYHHVCQLLDSFTCKGPNGDHICLILEPMKFSVFDIYFSLPGAMPLPLLKRISKHVLSALQYLHDDCGIVHTDIRGDNILISGDPVEEGQVEIKVKYDDLMSSIFKLSDFGAANMMANRFARMIQPGALRSPEVIIGAPWDTKADIWNLGCLIYEFARGTKLFDPHWERETSGLSPTQTHLSQIIGLRGDFPSSLLKTGSRTNLYFDDQGVLLQGGNRYQITLHDLLSRGEYSAEETLQLEEFLSPMLTIDPTKRWTAAQLLEHPWLSTVDQSAP